MTAASGPKYRCGAYIFLGAGLDPARHRQAFESAQGRFVTVGMDFARKAEVVEVAKALVAGEGVQLLELCGGFGPTWIAEVSRALGPQVPVGGVFYGPEYRRTLADLLSPA